MRSVKRNDSGGVKTKTDTRALKKLAVFIRGYIPFIAIALIFAVGGAVCTIIGPERISDLTNLLTESIMRPSGVEMAEFVRTCVTLIIIYAAGALAGYGSQFIMATVTQRTSKKLRTAIDRKIDRVPLGFFDSATKGDLLSRITNDVDIISQTLGSSTANLVSSFALFIGVIFKMFQTNWILSLVAIGTSVFGFVFMGIILARSQKYFNRKQADLGLLEGQIEEVYTHHNVVSSYGGKAYEMKRFSKINGDLFIDNSKSQFLSGMMMPIMNFAGNLSYVLIFIVGVAFIVNGNSAVTLGTISAFILYARLFSQPLTTFAQSMTSIQQASAASQRIFEFIDAEEMQSEENKTIKFVALDDEQLASLSDSSTSLEYGQRAAIVRTDEGTKLVAFKGNIEFRNVRFGYLPDKTVINDFSVALKAGQKVAIVGPTGAGKTTIVNLLMRFYECEGDILIDGIDTKEMRREDVRDLFDMILQDTWMFGGTIRENLVFNRTGVSDEKLDEVCAAVGLKHFIETLPKGYDTPLNDALNLSEGQKQQLTIARAMIKDAPLLILDEATSSVDTRTELIIQDAMDKLTENRTSFVIAHRLSTIRNADIILVMRNGDIVEQGTHKQLLEQNGFYAEIYNSQFVTT